MIDISPQSNSLGLPNYILNSFGNNLNSFHNSENSYIGFATFDSDGIQFYTLDKNKEISVTLMNDIKDPFCPISVDKLCLNVVQDQDDLGILIEKINGYIEKRRNIISTKSTYNITSSAIRCGINALEENGGRVMVFTTGGNEMAFANQRETKEKEFDYYNPRTTPEIESSIQKANKNRIAIDQFIFGNNSYDLPTFSTFSSLTGGNIKQYNYNPSDLIKNPNSLKSIFDKVYYDVIRIISRPNYYGVQINMRFSLGLEVLEILGGFNKKKGEGFSIASSDPDTSYMYSMRLNEAFENGADVSFQVAVIYTDNFGENYLRIINYTIMCSKDISQIYSFCDIDVMTKFLIMKELSSIYQITTKEIRENIENKIINMFYYYKLKTKQNNSSHLVLPSQVKYLPVLINSFFKKEILTFRNRNLNESIVLIYFFMKEPANSILLYLYPKMYKIDQEDNSIRSKIRLSCEAVEKEKMYFYFDGNYLDLLIFEGVDDSVTTELFGHSFSECIYYNVTEFNNESNGAISGFKESVLEMLDEKMKEKYYVPLRLNFITEPSNISKNMTVYSKLVEDGNKIELSYPEFLYYLYEKIEKKFG